MTRNVPAALQMHLDGVGTTTCRLLKITLRDGVTSFGFTTLDQDVVYDDGDGEMTYTATNGFDPSALSTSADYQVANAETFMLISDDVSPGITEEDVQRGALNDAQWKLYLINFHDSPSQGHILLDAGDVGQVRTRFGLVWMPELLSRIVRLRQPLGSVDSRTCRAVFGSPADSQTGCGFDVSGLWENGEVTAVGAETDAMFTGDAAPSIVPFPGRIEWLTGDNAGVESWVDLFDAGEVRLGEGTPFPIQIGDTYRIRPDCRKRFQEDCIDTWDNGINFKGEPYIPVGDTAAISTPGAQYSGSSWVAPPQTDEEEP